MEFDHYGILRKKSRDLAGLTTTYWDHCARVALQTGPPSPTPGVHGVSSSLLLGPVIPSVRAMSRGLKLTVRRHTFNKDSLPPVQRFVFGFRAEVQDERHSSTHDSASSVADSCTTEE